jgi:hypothetical protein
MLGLRVVVGVGKRGQWLRALLDQRGARGGVEGGVGQWVKDCSSFLEGKEELGVEKALFRVGLSASWDIVGEADMAGACVSKRVLRNGGVRYGG